MKNISNFLKTFSFVFFLGIISVTVNAQKLPNVQQISLRAPTDIKIDGNAKEWNNQFQAYNHATNIFYTLSNDDKNLYLAVQESDTVLIAKIMSGGVSLTINTSGKKDVKEAANITYPAFEKGAKNRVFITKAGTDSFATANNRQLAAKSKFIRVTGIKGMDTLTSIYNRDGIKAVSLFDNKMGYIYELAIDLSLLGLDTANPQKFAYNIALPGQTSVLELMSKQLGIPVSAIRVTYIPDPEHPPSTYNPHNPHGYRINAPTDFWGEYTLAQK